MRHSVPFFSIIVPTYERARQLVICLRALAQQNYPRERFEVLVVDDGSTISPAATVNRFLDKLNVSLLSQLHSGPAAARNYGARHATGTFLAFTDDDCAPSPRWLQTLAAGFDSFPDSALGGRTINGFPNNRYSTTSQLLTDYLYARWNSDPQRATFLMSNNLALPAARFHDLGGFDPAWNNVGGEDRELCDRWLLHGYRMVYLSEAVVEHFHTLTWRTFLRQHFHYGRGGFHFHRASARRRLGFVRLERPSFYLRAVLYPLFQERASKALSSVPLILAAQVANAAGFFWEYLYASAKDLLSRAT